MRATAETLAAYGAGSDPARQAHQAYPNARDAVAGACRDDGPVPVRRSGLACFLAHYVRELDGPAAATGGCRCRPRCATGSGVPRTTCRSRPEPAV